jgi:hypothetical protein
VITEALSLERQMQLLGTVNDGSYSPMTRIAGLLEGFEEYLEQQMDARNYNLVLNIAFAIGVERQRQLFGSSDSNRLVSIWDKITAFNRFKMDLQVQYKAKSEDGSQSNLTATNLNPVYVTFGKQDCKFTIYGVENTSEGIAWFVYYRGGYEIPLMVTNGSGTEIINRDDGTTYTITHDLSGLNLKFGPPFGAVSFCEDGKQDSLQFEPDLQPYGPRDKRHSYMHSFMTEMVNDGYPESLPEEIEQVQDELQELSLKAKDKETERFKKPLLPELEQQYAEERRRKQLHLRESQYEERENPSTVVFDARNGEAEIIDAKTAMEYDGMKYSGREDKATLTITVKIVHDPLPYKDKKPSK